MLFFSVVLRRGKMSVRGDGLDLKPQIPSLLKSDVRSLLPLKKRKYVSETTDDVCGDLSVNSRTSHGFPEGGVVVEALKKSCDPREWQNRDQRSFYGPTADLVGCQPPHAPKELTQVEIFQQSYPGRSSMAPYLQGELQASQTQNHQTTYLTARQTRHPCDANPRPPSAHLTKPQIFPVGGISSNPQSFVSQIVSSMTKGDPHNIATHGHPRTAVHKGDLRRTFLASTAAARSGLPNWKPLDLSTKHISTSSSSGDAECATSGKRKRTKEPTNDEVDVTAAAGSSEISGASESKTSSPHPMPINPQHSLRMLRECELAVRPDADGDLPLHIAVVKGDTESVDTLLGMMKVAGVSLDYVNKLRQTALHLAVITRQPEMVLKLVREGSSPDMPDRYGNTSVHLAVKTSRECLSSMLDSAKSRPNLDGKNYDGLAPLHLAVQKGDVSTVKILLEKGANIDIMDGKSGRTPLHHASETQKYEVVEELLARGSRVNVQSYSGNTPLHAASERSFKVIVDALVRHGADPTIRNGNNETYTKEAKTKVSASHSVTRTSARPSQAPSTKKSRRTRRPPKQKSHACQATLTPPSGGPFDCDHDYFMPAIPKTNCSTSPSRQGSLNGIQVKVAPHPMGDDRVPNIGESAADSPGSAGSEPNVT